MQPKNYKGRSVVRKQNIAYQTVKPMKLLPCCRTNGANEDRVTNDVVEQIHSKMTEKELETEEQETTQQYDCVWDERVEFICCRG